MMRDLLLTMYDWKVGNKFNWQISTGKNHKLLKNTFLSLNGINCWNHIHMVKL